SGRQAARAREGLRVPARHRHRRGTAAVPARRAAGDAVLRAEGAGCRARGAGASGEDPPHRRRALTLLRAVPAALIDLTGSKWSFRASPFSEQDLPACPGVQSGQGEEREIRPRAVTVTAA